MKGPLTAVISVGIAAAAPAVAISASTPNAEAGSPAQSTGTVSVTDPHQPPGPVGINQKTSSEIRHERLVHKFLVLRKRANRLIAKRDHRKVRSVRTPVQVQWSNHALVEVIHVLRKRIERLRVDLRSRRAGLTPAVRAFLGRVAACESHGNPRAIGGGGAFRGKYQFTYSTWASVGGWGDPARAPEAEQDLRAAILLKRSGSSPWPVCG